MPIDGARPVVVAVCGPLDLEGFTVHLKPRLFLLAEPPLHREEYHHTHQQPHGDDLDAAG
jgi:hypothetical protein